MSLHGGLRGGWQRWLEPSRSLLHFRHGEPQTEHVDAERLSPERIADVFRLSYADTYAAPTNWPSQVDSQGAASADQPDPEAVFDGLPNESWMTDLVSEGLAEDAVQEVPADLVGEDRLPEVPAEDGLVLDPPEDLVSGDLAQEDLEGVVPGVREDVDAEDSAIVVPETLVPQIGRHRRPTFFERVAPPSRRRVS